MHTTLFQLGPFAIRSYGLMLALSFLCGILLARRRVTRMGIDAQRIMDLAVVVIVSSIVGSRALYVLFHLEEFSANPLDIINPFQSSGEVGIQGLTMYGGVLLSIIASLWFLRRHGLPIWKIADAIAPSIALGVFLTRIGCFLNGCCFGKPGDYPWCVVFPPESAAGYFFPHQHIHPTQLYASLYGLLIFGLLLFLERFKKFDGFTFWLFLLLYAVARFSIDFVRFYEGSMTLSVLGMVLSVNHVISAALFVLALGMMILLNHKRPSAA
ncbi:MAG: prolipoprotein diacylglyceryl transferase [Gemmatimonadota bacterium]|nr:MAG: prolipoprotein diacylglyceryl transferase [Gemmatimonadota bacterium]